MTEQPFQQTPLFQLNLLLWLSMPIQGDRLTPVFWESGFETYAIAASIRVPVEAQLRVNEHAGRAAVANSVKPDLLMRHKSLKALLTIECKISSFGPTADGASQALGILTCTGAHIADFLGLPRPDQWKALGAYAVSHPQQTLMAQTLTALAKQIKAAAVDDIPATAFGVEVAADGIYLEFSDPPTLPLNIAGRQKVMTLEVGEDPRPLYLIPLDPSVDAQDAYGKRVVQERLRSAFASLVASRLDRSSLTVTWDELMTNAIQVWPLWKDRDSTRNLVGHSKTYVRKILVEISRLGLTTEPTPNGFTLAGIDRSSAQQIRRYLMGIAYRQGELDLWQEGVQLGFEEVGGWDVVDSQG